MSDALKTMVQTALISRVALLIENLTYPEHGIPLDCKEWIEKLKSIAFILEEELSQYATALAQAQARVAELEVDAARYRFIRNLLAIEDVERLVADGNPAPNEQESLRTDAAIDAALKDRP